MAEHCSAWSPTRGSSARHTIQPGGGTPLEQDFAYDGVNRLKEAREFYEPGGGPIKGRDTIGT
jgi:hypothetical protein